MKNVENVMMDVSGKFWTRRNELIDYLERLDYEVVEVGNDHVVVVDLRDDDETEYTLNIAYANRTMWIESVQ